MTAAITSGQVDLYASFGGETSEKIEVTVGGTVIVKAKGLDMSLNTDFSSARETVAGV